MLLNKLVKATVFLLFALLLFTPLSFAGRRGGPDVPDTDSGDAFVLFSFFDLRDRESFVQVTNLAPVDAKKLHVQIFDVSNNCNENNFFDNYTPNDTHVYNMRDILTNDGSDSGVVLPDGAYGFVAISEFSREGTSLIGNFRILDVNGYEYRTNSVNPFSDSRPQFWRDNSITFNFNTKGNVTLSDVVGIPFNARGGDGILEIAVADITSNFFPFDINILNNNEVTFSCRNVIFSCVNQDHPRLEELLERAGVASVASFEYGINNAIPHSKGGELLCPGNIIDEGFVTMTRITSVSFPLDNFIGFIGLNNGNGRGSMDSFWYPNDAIPR